MTREVNGHTSDPDAVRLSPVARVGRLVAFATVATVLLISAFVAGTFVRTDQPLISSDIDRIMVDALVEVRDFGAGLVAQGTVAGGAQLVVEGSSTSESARSVVTAVTIAPGAQLGNMQMLGTVSDRPLWVLNMPVPMYRDILMDDVGTDVSALQTALGAPVTGRFDRSTQRVLETLYVANGFRPPGGRGWGVFARMDEIVAISSKATVRETAELGSVLSVENPLAVLDVGSPIVTFRATVLEVDELVLDSVMQLRGTAGGEAVATVTSIGSFQQATGAVGGEISGHDIVLTVAEDGLPEDLQPGRAVLISKVDAENETLLGFPELAIRTGPNGDHVLVVKANGNITHVQVSVLARQDGWVGIAEGGPLKSGDIVRLSP